MQDFKKYGFNDIGQHCYNELRKNRSIKPHLIRYYDNKYDILVEYIAEDSFNKYAIVQLGGATREEGYIKFREMDNTINYFTLNDLINTL